MRLRSRADRPGSRTPTRGPANRVAAKNGRPWCDFSADLNPPASIYVMDQSRCPACGHELPESISDATITQCPSCQTDFREENWDVPKESPANWVPDPALVPEFAARYRLDDVIGRGAMGVVYRATQLATRRVVAIKFLINAKEPELLARFVAEGRLLGRIHHDNVVKVFDAGEFQSHPYQVT